MDPTTKAPALPFSFSINNNTIDEIGGINVIVHGHDDIQDWTFYGGGVVYYNISTSAIYPGGASWFGTTIPKNASSDITVPVTIAGFAYTSLQNDAVLFQITANSLDSAGTSGPATIYQLPAATVGNNFGRQVSRDSNFTSEMDLLLSGTIISRSFGLGQSAAMTSIQNMLRDGTIITDSASPLPVYTAPIDILTAFKLITPSTSSSPTNGSPSRSSTSPSSTTSKASSQGESHNGLSSGAIAGIVIGILAAVAISLTFIFLLLLRRRRNLSRTQDPTTAYESTKDYADGKASVPRSLPYTDADDLRHPQHHDPLLATSTATIVSATAAAAAPGIVASNSHKNSLSVSSSGSPVAGRTSGEIPLGGVAAPMGGTAITERQLPGLPQQHHSVRRGLGSDAAVQQLGPSSDVESQRSASPDFEGLPVRSTSVRSAGRVPKNTVAAVLVEDGMTEEQIRELEDEERELDAAIARRGTQEDI